MMKSQNLEDQIYDEFNILTKTIKSVVILTSQGDKHYINTFFHSTSNQITDIVLHETLANAIHAKISWVNTNTIEDDVIWPKDDSDSDFTALNDSKLIDIFRKMKSKSTQFQPLHKNITSNTELLAEYHRFYGQMSLIGQKLKAMQSEGKINCFVLIGNFNDLKGYYQAGCQREKEKIELENMVQEWLIKLSQTEGFSISLLNALIKQWDCDDTVLVSDMLNQQLSKPEDEASLRLRRGILYKFPKLGNRFTLQQGSELNNDVDFQRFADDLKMINPRSYFMAIETHSALYLSLPADISNASLISLLYFAYERYLMSHGLTLDYGSVALAKSLEISLKSKIAEGNIKNHPLTRKNRENLLYKYGRRTRKFTQAGCNLASYQASDIAQALNQSKDVENFIITYSMKNRNERVIYSDSIRNDYDSDDMADVINQISYMIGGVMGKGSDQIWHSFDTIFTAIQTKDIKQVRDLLKD